MFHVQGLNTVCMDAIEKKGCETLSGSERGTHSPALSLHVPDIVLPSSVSYPSPKQGYRSAGHIPPPSGTDTGDTKLNNYTSK